MISAIILSQSNKGSEETLFVDYVSIEIQRSGEKQYYKFPVESWIRKCRQDKKSEEFKARFGRKNSIVVFPHEKPKFDYRLKISPQISKDTEYKIQVCYDVKQANKIVEYRFDLKGYELPKQGYLMIRLNGTYGLSEPLKLSADVKSDDEVYSVKTAEIGQIKHVSVMVDDVKETMEEYELGSFEIIDSEQTCYKFSLDENLTVNKPKAVRPTEVIHHENEEENTEPPSDEGLLFMKIEGQSGSTTEFELKGPIESSNGAHTFKKLSDNVGGMKKVVLRYEGLLDTFASIKSVKITNNKGNEFNVAKSFVIKNEQETSLIDKNNKKLPKTEAKKKGEFFVQIIGDKKRTDLFHLADPEFDEEDVDVFAKTDNDLGKIKQVYVKYTDDSKNEIKTGFIEIVDPRGNSYKFNMGMILKGGDDVMLPLKNAQSRPKSESEEEKFEPEPEPEPEEIEQESESEESEPTIEPEPNVKEEKPVVNPSPSIAEYEIEISKGAGITKIPISIIIYGEDGSYTDTLMFTREDDSNENDVFKIEDKNVGKIEKISLDYYDHAFNGTWYLNSVQISKDGEKTLFPVQRGFSKSETIVLKPNEVPAINDDQHTENILNADDANKTNTGANLFSTTEDEEE